MKQSIQLSDHFTYGRLLRFTLPSIGMMIFTSIYGVVDGFFVSNFAGKTAFAAINLIMPLLMIFSTVGFMFGTGGSALVAKTLGEAIKRRQTDIFLCLSMSVPLWALCSPSLGCLLRRLLPKLWGLRGRCSTMQCCIPELFWQRFPSAFCSCCSSPS